MTIQLPGYTPFDGNAVHLKDESVSVRNIQEPLKELIRLDWFKQPTVYEIAEYLMQKTVEAQRNAKPDFDEGIVLEGETELETNILKLSDETIQELQECDDRIRGIIRYDIAAYESEEGESAPDYLRIRHVLIRNESIAQSTGNTKMFSDTDLRTRRLVGFLEIKILLDNMALPQEEHIYRLLEQGVWGSRVLKIKPENYCPKEAGEVIETVYTGLSTPNKIRQLKDISDDILEEYANRTIEELINIDAEEGIWGGDVNITSNILTQFPVNRFKRSPPPDKKENLN